MQSGEVVWRYEREDADFWDPTVVDGTIFVTDRGNDELLALEPT